MYLLPFLTKLNQHVSKGFTILEILIVVLILGVIASFALPTLQSGLEQSKLSGAASEIAVALEYAQLTTMATGGQTRVTIDANADTILVEQFKSSTNLLGGGTEYAEADVEGGSFMTMGHPVKKGEDYLITFASEDRFSGVDIAQSSFGANNFVVFDAPGVPSDGGTVSISLGGGQVTVTVDSLTGKVTSSE